MDRINMTREEYRSKRKKRRRLRPVVFWIFIVFFSIPLFLSGYKLVDWQADNNEINKIVEEIEELAQPVEIEEEGELIAPPVEEEKVSDYWYYVQKPFFSVDFNELLNINKHTVGYVYLPNTNINYPVVQTNDNKYYLTHAFNGSRNAAGWVFMDYRNSATNLSDNTIIYGHGRLNKTVFGSLKDVLNKNWQANKDNYVIYFSTPTENMVFQIFSIYTIKSEAYYLTSKFYSETTKMEWINTMKQRNIAPINVDVGADSKMITLSTCLDDNGGRVVVHAKLIKKAARQ